MANLVGRLSGKGHLSGTIRAGTDPHERYTGEYNVTPLCNKETVLETSGKILTQDITVFEIPYAEVANPAGGTTVTIGG